MGHSSARSISTLIAPVFALAALSGALIGGALSGVLTVSPYLAEPGLWDSELLSADLSIMSTWTLFGAVAGLFYGLVAGAGAITAMAIQSAKCSPVTIREQAFASACGAAAVAAALAGFSVVLDTEAAVGSFVWAGAFVVATFLVSLIVGRIYLKRLDARDPSTTAGERSKFLGRRYGPRCNPRN
ncbi:hypothetical protein Q2T94_04185 [Paeniglutamicibacter sulfureus]|uniref:hypothetical protein n=1 Tax=Paeniglutamicibacter sulfureus TaxID=43666 RepID=UPI002666DEF6|nr:hypothetical protein [Paeniglutamicibacter sulfureus]MDO2933506.1 hypothetical protein [Paeniglutamicibacter sulfureus]